MTRTTSWWPSPGRGRRETADAFLAGYLAVPEVAVLLPTDVEARTLVLRAFELDKAVYELAYELNYRPDQAAIPAAGIARLVAG